MESPVHDTAFLQHLAGKTTIVTGGSNGIGAHTVKLFSSQGSNVVIADLESTVVEAEALIDSLPHPSSALFVPTNILDWEQMKLLFRRTIEHFSRVDIVVANAGIMESKNIFDLVAVDNQGELQESVEGFRVLDVNLKGTLNSKSLPTTCLYGVRLIARPLRSTAIGVVSHAIKRPMFPRLFSRLRCSRNVDFGILWQQWRGGLHCLQTRPCWTSSGIPTDCQGDSCDSKCGGAILHSNTDIFKAIGEMGRLRSEGEYIGGCRDRNCSSMSSA